MFSVAEKHHIADVVEKTIRELNHPEMDPDNITFRLRIDGKESWSYAQIHENSRETNDPPRIWNEVARDYMPAP